MKGTPSQMIDAAKRSIRAARVLLDEDLPDQAASRAYYAMFYVASALLKNESLEFSSHSAVHAAFGRELANPNRASLARCIGGCSTHSFIERRQTTTRSTT
ncbi:MAG: HEPN domain-containing protein [bacterium]|nr:HEPN domain-containing protein [bacterium]